MGVERNCRTNLSHFQWSINIDWAHKGCYSCVNHSLSISYIVVHSYIPSLLMIIISSNVSLLLVDIFSFSGVDVMLYIESELPDIVSLLVSTVTVDKSMNDDSSAASNRFSNSFLLSLLDCFSP